MSFQKLFYQKFHPFGPDILLLLGLIGLERVGAVLAARYISQ